MICAALFTNILEEGFSDLRLLSRSWKLATVSNALATEKMCNFGDTLAHGACYKGEEGPHLLRLAGRSSKKFSLEKKKGAKEQCARGQRTRSR